MIARLDNLSNLPVVTDTPPIDCRLRVNCFTIKEEDNFFPGLSLMDQIVSDQLDEGRGNIKEMKELVATIEFLSAKLLQLRELVLDHTDVFRSLFFSGLSTDIFPLKIDLVVDARAERVGLRSYSQEQRGFFSGMVKGLVANGFAYPNPASP